MSDIIHIQFQPIHLVLFSEIHRFDIEHYPPYILSLGPNPCPPRLSPGQRKDLKADLVDADNLAKFMAARAKVVELIAKQDSTTFRLTLGALASAAPRRVPPSVVSLCHVEAC